MVGVDVGFEWGWEIGIELRGSLMSKLGARQANFSPCHHVTTELHSDSDEVMDLNTKDLSFDKVCDLGSIPSFSPNMHP